MLKQGYLSLTHVVEEKLMEEKVVEETSKLVSKQNILDVIMSQVTQYKTCLLSVVKSPK